MSSASIIEKLADGGQTFYDGLVFRNFAVEDSQRIGYRASPAINAHFIDHGGQCLAQGFAEFCAVCGAAHRIQFECPACDANAVEQCGQKFQDLGIPCWRGAAGGDWSNDFGSDLVELAVTALLRTLAAELRADIKELVETAVPKFVLNVCANHPGGVFRAQSQRLAFIAFSAAAIFPSEHFFRDDIRLFANSAGEEFG